MRSSDGRTHGSDGAVYLEVGALPRCNAPAYRGAGAMYRFTGALYWYNVAMYRDIGALHLYIGALTPSTGTVEGRSVCVVSSFVALILWLVAMYRCRATLYRRPGALISSISSG